MAHPADETLPATHDAYAALRDRNYRRFAAGFACSSTGLQMLAMALGWELYERTRDPLVLGLVGLCRALPVVVMSLPAGYVIDAFDRKRVLIATQYAFAVGAALLACLSYANAPVWITLVAVTLLGCIRSFNGPVRSSLLPDLVTGPAFPNAVTWNSAIFQVSATAGPLLAGSLIAATGVAWPVYVCTAAMCGILGTLAIGLRPRAHHASDSSSPRRLSFAGMLSGMSHVWREKTILAALSLDLFAVLLGGATALIPVYASEILHVDAVGQGWLRAAPFIGAAAMSIILAYRPLGRRVGIKMLLSVAGFGLCTIGFGFSTNFWLSLAMLFLLGVCDNVSVVVRHVLVQHRTPRHLRGRVSAVNSVFIESSNELGAFESGAVAKLFGPVFSVVSGGVGTILVVIGIAAALPEIRRLDRLDEEPSSPPDDHRPRAAPSALPVETSASSLTTP